MQHSDNRARLYRTRLIAAISILAGSLHLPATAGPTADQDLSLCTDKVANHTIRIANCSMVLTAGDLSDNARGAALYNRGQAYLAQGQAEKALDDFNAALEIAPDSEDLLLNRAATLRKLGQYEAAIADYDRLLSRDYEPRAALYFNRGIAYHYLNKEEEAIRDMEKAYALDPENLHFLETLDQTKRLYKLR